MGKKKDKQKLSRLSLDELFWRLRADGYQGNVYWIKVKEYLNTRIKSKNFLSEYEIELLNKYAGEMIGNVGLAVAIREDISKCSTRLIVMSKNTKETGFIDRISRYDVDCISGLTPDDIKIFFETTLKYSLNCLSRTYLKTILNSLVCDVNYLENLRDYLKEDRHLDAFDRKVNNMKQKCNVSEIFKIKKPNIVVKSMEKLPALEGKNILTIDRPGSIILDSAFSIEKKDGLYFFNVYVSDVPSFLLQHEKLLKYAYEMGTSMYNYQYPEELYKVDMIPSELSKKYLSMNKDSSRNVIVFSFCIDDKGTIQLVNVSRNRVVTNENIDTKSIRGFEIYNPKTDRDVDTCIELCRLVRDSSPAFNYSLAHKKKLANIVAFPSILVNYQVGRDSNLALYREDGKYTTDSEHKYAHASAPMRKFAADINLVLYLSQLGLINCPDKYIHYIEDNINSIIEHLNRREDLCEYFENNYKEIKKYYKK